MKSKAERLDELLEECMLPWPPSEMRKRIIDIVIECVPEERHGKHEGHAEDDGYCYKCMETVEDKDLGSFGDWAWNACLAETLRNIEELRK